MNWANPSRTFCYWWSTNPTSQIGSPSRELQAVLASHHIWRWSKAAVLFLGVYVKRKDHKGQKADIAPTSFFSLCLSYCYIVVNGSI